MERKVDDLGRLVIPKEIFNAWGVDSKDRPVMCIDDWVNHIRIYPKLARCVFCGIMLPPPYDNSLRHYKGRALCPSCFKAIGAEVQQSGGLVTPALIIPQADNTIHFSNLQDEAQ